MFFIATSEGKEGVEYRHSIKYMGYTWIIHRSTSEHYKWTVSEFSTGTSAGVHGNTLEEIKTNIINKMDTVGQEFIDKKIKAAIKEHGVLNVEAR